MQLGRRITAMEKVKKIVNGENDRVFDAIFSEDGNVKIKVKTGKGKGSQAFRMIMLDEVLTQIREADTTETII